MQQLNSLKLPFLMQKVGTFNTNAKQPLRGMTIDSWVAPDIQWFGSKEKFKHSIDGRHHNADIVVLGI